MHWQPGGTIISSSGPSIHDVAPRTERLCDHFGHSSRENADRHYACSFHTFGLSCRSGLRINTPPSIRIQIPTHRGGWLGRAQERAEPSLSPDHRLPALRTGHLGLDRPSIAVNRHRHP